MNYCELSFCITPYDEAAGDVLAALLADAGFETFVPTPEGLRAYVPQPAFDEDALGDILRSMPFPDTRVTYTLAHLPDENWNAAWEASHRFTPIPLPDGRQMEIVPRQAFGSGEHATTRMMLQLLAEADPRDRTVIDAGCGTGVLAIAAAMQGAQRVVAYDIDPWSVSNAKDNCRRNHTTGVDVWQGDARLLLHAPKAHIVMANINRNILLADMPAFARHLLPGGQLLLSGFLGQDEQTLCRHAQQLGLTHRQTRAEGEWRAIHLTKPHRT